MVEKALLQYGGRYIKIGALSLVVFLFSQCGNPAIIRTLAPVNANLNNLAEAAPLSEQNAWRYRIADADNLYIEMGNVQQYEFEVIIETEKNENGADGFRIPGLTYIKYEIENKSDASITIDLFQIAFVDDLGNQYAPISKIDFQEQYTSAAYSLFQYDTIFAFYVTHIERGPSRISPRRVFKKGGPDDTTQGGEAGSPDAPGSSGSSDKKGAENIPAEKKWFYYYQYGPGQEVVIPPASRSFQIIAYPLFSEAARSFTMKIPGILSSDPKELKFTYEIQRNGGPEIFPEKWKSGG